MEHERLDHIGTAVWAPALEVLEQLSVPELRRRHDALVSSDFRPAVSIEYYLQELARRQQAQQTALMIKLTGAITAMTLVSTLFVILSATHAI